MNRRRTLIAATTIGVVAAVFILASSRAYSPGRLSAGHAPFEGNCASCHQPWHPLDNSGCTACHGDYVATNPHRSVKLTGARPDLLAGKMIRVFRNPETHADTMSCLSCHTDHRGRRPNLAITASTNCTFCHPHVSNDDPTPQNRKDLQRPYGSTLAVKSAFVHSKEMAVLKTRDHSIRHLPCEACHRLESTGPEHAETFVILRTGLKITAIPSSPLETNSVPPTPALSNSAPPLVDEYAKIWDSIPSTTAEVPLFTSVKHLNALFRHSAAHLGYKCGSCHSDIDKSTRAGDPNARTVEQCFDCHSKKPPGELTVASEKSGSRFDLLGASLALAEIAPSRKNAPQYKTCGECHNFHLSGTAPTNDFPRRAPSVRPQSVHGHLTLAAFTIDLAPLETASTKRLAPARIGLVPLLGLIAIALASLSGVALVRWSSRRDSAPDPTVPAVIPDVAYHTESFETNIERLYVVGEVAGIGSINLAIRSGRQAVDAIASKVRLSNLPNADGIYHVAIVGCGPAGLGAATTAKVEGLSHLILERMTPASSIRDYPRDKFLQAAPIEIREYGGEFIMETDNTKESLIAEWEKAIARTGLAIHQRSEVVAIERAGDLFDIKTAAGEVFKSHFVVVAIGVHGSPNHLNVPGETPDRVFY